MSTSSNVVFFFTLDVDKVSSDKNVNQDGALKTSSV